MCYLHVFRSVMYFLMRDALVQGPSQGCQDPFVSIRLKIVAHVQVHQMQLKQILQVDSCGTFSRSDANGETVTTWGG